MREIKFRAWDRHNKVWVGPYNLKQLADDDQFNYDTEVHPISSKFSSFDWVEWTGLKDKNGKEIYEGDIYRVPKKGRGIGAMDLVVAFQHAGFWIIKYGYKDTSPRKMTGRMNKKLGEVIGSIYENPELLGPQ